MNRRGFLGAMLAACAAPAIVRAGSIMRINPRIITFAEVEAAFDIAHWRKLEALAFCKAMEKVLFFGEAIYAGEINAINAGEIHAFREAPFEREPLQDSRIAGSSRIVISGFNVSSKFFSTERK